MYVRNWWYMIAWSAEVATAPKRRLIMNEPVVLYRLGDGRAVALEDRCPHRNYPLSKGTVVGDSLECGYHGLRLGADGSCVHAPGQDLPPQGSRIKAYQLAERAGILWIWMGDDEADEALLPDMSWLEQAGWTPWISGYIPLKCAAQLLTENLLDSSHLAFVHKTSMGTDPNVAARGQVSVTQADHGVNRRVRLPGIPTPPTYRASSAVGAAVDQWIESSMRPGLYQNYTRVRSAQSDPDWENGSYPFENRSFHGIVPETDTTTHYFHGGSRLDADIEYMSGAKAHKILLEDVDVLEAIQQNLAYVGDRPVLNLKNDMVAMQWRMALKRMLGTTGSQAHL